MKRRLQGQLHVAERAGTVSPDAAAADDALVQIRHSGVMNANDDARTIA